MAERYFLRPFYEASCLRPLFDPSLLKLVFGVDEVTPSLL